MIMFLIYLLIYILMVLAICRFMSGTSQPAGYRRTFSIKRAIKSLFKNNRGQK